MRRGFLSTLLILQAVPLLLAAIAFADPIQNLYNGAREMGMGGVSTAVTEGDEAIFLNPAAMAENQDAKFYLLNEQVEISGDTIREFESSRTAFNNISFSTLQQLVGKDIYARSQFSPSITLPNFGVAFLVDDQFQLRAQNLSLPDVSLGLQETNGVQFATGFSVLGGGKHATDDLRLGAGYKIMWRRGGYNDLSLDQILNINEDLVKQITGNYGIGQAMDFGAQYIHKTDMHLDLMAGVDYQNIGGMTFNEGGEMQPEDLSLGVAAKFHEGRDTSVTVGYDMKNLTNGYPMSRMNHFGAELQIPAITLDGGLSESRYLTGGATVDLWLIKLTALTYAEELGEFSGQEGERIYALRITFKLDI